MSSYSQVAKSGFVWGILGRWSTELLAIPTAMILARLLTPREFGVAAAAAFFVQIGTSLTAFGFNVAIVRLKELREEHTSTIFWINITASGLIWAALALASPWLARVFRSQEAGQVIPWAALTIWVGSFASVQAALLQRQMRYKTLAKLDVLATLINSVSSITLALAGFGVWSLVYPSVASFATQAVMRTIVTRWFPKACFSRAALQEVFSFGLGIQAKRLLDTTALNVDNLVVGRTLGMASLGFYDKAFSTMNRAVSALSTVGPTVSFRIFSIIQDDRERFRRAYRKVALTSTLLAYPVLTGLAFSGASLFAVMFGPKWATAVFPFQVLCIAGTLKMQNAYASVAIQSKGNVWGEVGRQVLYVSLVIGGAYVGSGWGPAGVAIAVMAATVVMWTMMHQLLIRLTGMRWADVLGPQGPSIACAVLVGMTAWIVRAVVVNPLQLQPLIALALQFGACALVFAMFLLLGPSDDVRELVRETVEQFAPRLSGIFGGRRSAELPRDERVVTAPGGPGPV